MVSLFGSSGKLISVFAKIRPVWLKKGLFSLIFSVYFQLSRLKAIVKQMNLPVFLVSGVGKNSGEQIQLLYAGREDFPLFLIKLLFNNQPLVEQVGTVFVWRLHTLDRFSFDADAVLVSCDRFYRRFLHRDVFFVFPHMVDMVLDCSQGLDQIMKNVSEDAKRGLKKVTNNNFSYEISSDIDKVSMFYQDMYVPMVVNRIGRTDMFIPDFSALRFFLQMGYELLLTVLDGVYVCGSYFYHHHDVMEVKYFGIYQGNVELYRKKVSAADQYFSILAALERKVSRLDYGGARPFFDDGLFYYKQKWGTSVEQYHIVPDVFGLKILKSGVMKSFLLKNPFIGLSQDNRFVGYVFVDKDGFSEEMRDQLEKRYMTPGLDDILFVEV